MHYSRRKFIGSASKGVAGLTLISYLPFQLSACSNNHKAKSKLGVALVGMGGYSKGQLAPALQETEHCYMAGFVTGTPAKEQVYGEKYNIPDANIYNYGNMDEIANNDDIDIIYIVLPNAMHADYAVKAAEAGKHVICEKPMTTTVHDAQRIIDACNKNKVKLSIGYRLHFDPFNKEMMRFGQNKVYGNLQEVKGGFGFPLDNPYQWRLDKSMAGGGSLMDVGIYAVQSAIYSVGEMPETVKANIIPNESELFSEVEDHIKWTFNFPSGVVAEGESTYSSYMNYLDVKAEKGSFGLEPAYSYGGLKGFKPEGKLDLSNVNQQARQMDDFAKRIKNNTETPVPGEMGLRDMAILEAIYKSAETGSEVKIDPAYSILNNVKE